MGNPGIQSSCSMHVMNMNVLEYLLSNSTEQCPSWEANRFSASQEIPQILWNPKVHYRFHNSLPPVPTQS
jgi:hypothetical protein